jgi:hypothetical protein
MGQYGARGGTVPVAHVYLWSFLGLIGVFSALTARIASGSEDKMVRVWDAIGVAN